MKSKSFYALELELEHFFFEFRFYYRTNSMKYSIADDLCLWNVLEHLELLQKHPKIVARWW